MRAIHQGLDAHGFLEDAIDLVVPQGGQLAQRRRSGKGCVDGEQQVGGEILGLVGGQGLDVMEFVGVAHEQLVALGELLHKRTPRILHPELLTSLS